jgi:hypothetical protein
MTANLKIFLPHSHILGWIDDLAFYNRAMTSSEIASKWNKAADTTDSSLFIYYDFDEGPGAADVIKNHGVAGSVADINNGKIFGGKLYYDTVSSGIRNSIPADMVN